MPAEVVDAATPWVFGEGKTANVLKDAFDIALDPLQAVEASVTDEVTSHAFFRVVNTQLNNRYYHNGTDGHKFSTVMVVRYQIGHQDSSTGNWMLKVRSGEVERLDLLKSLRSHGFQRLARSMIIWDGRMRSSLARGSSVLDLTLSALSPDPVGASGSSDTRLQPIHDSMYKESWMQAVVFLMDNADYECYYDVTRSALVIPEIRDPSATCVFVVEEAELYAMVQHGVLKMTESEFGDSTVEVVQATMKFTLEFAVRTGVCACNMEYLKLDGARTAVLEHTKLGLMMKLSALGWQASSPSQLRGGEYQLGTPLMFDCRHSRPHSSSSSSSR
jgi:hypothetical protein